jgi:hypothetical protein
VQCDFPFWYYFVVSSRSGVVPTPDLVPLSFESLGAYTFCKPVGSSWKSRFELVALIDELVS